MDNNQTLIAIEDLSYSVGTKLILRDIGIEIKEKKEINTGGVVALLGPSGVGKTTLFNLLSGFLKPTTGKILAHMDEEGMQEVHSHIMGVVRQDYPLFEHRTVLSNLMLVCKTPEKVGEMHQLVSDFHLEEVVSSYPIEISGGQRQRVAIIQQILCSEKYILMDEPFSGLDLIAKCDVCKLIGKVIASHPDHTIIIVTHDIADAIKVADTLWLLGRDKDAEGKFIPGARIKKTVNLRDRGFTGGCCAINNGNFFDTVKEIQTDFLQL